MKKLLVSFLFISVLFLSACFDSTKELDYEALDYNVQPEITVKTPEEWLELVSVASAENEDITSYLDTQVCIPTTSEICYENGECKEAEPSTFLFVSSFEPSTGETLSVSRNIYRCNETKGCDKGEYSYYYDSEQDVYKLQTRGNELTLSGDGYTEVMQMATNEVTNTGICYYRDELNLAAAKVESANQYDLTCEVDESNFGIDWVGINQTFELREETELRASPISMDCNVLTIVPAGELISIQTQTEGAANTEDNFIWLKITYSGHTGWIRGDFLDDQFQR